MNDGIDLVGALAAYLEAHKAEEENIAAANRGEDFEAPIVLETETREAMWHCQEQARRKLEHDPRNRMARGIMVMFGEEMDASESCGLYPRD